ncbi:MAG: T9SS type A sorting domain-containing protein [Bacteroidota bacterium]|nr:T9SS type A sorting domain-containing protein [Bacteroidota bacterium]
MKREAVFSLMPILISLCIFIALPSQVVSQAIDSFFEAGVHPTASLQSTTRGKQLMTLFPWRGKLYSGYGDYGANTGPISIYSFSPDSLTFTFEAEANTEAIYNYRLLNGLLYAPAIDRKSYGIPGDYIKQDSSGRWTNYNFGSNSTHTFDAINLNDSVVFMTGSQESNAVVWKSTNNGQTWKKILTDTAISGVAGDFARFYFAGVYNGKLYVQARDFYGPMHPNSKVYDGTTWAAGPSLFPTFSSLGWRPEVFVGKLVYRSWEPGSSTQLRSFNGTTTSWVDSLWVYDCFIDSNYFYALVDSGYGVKNLRRTTDLINWENLLRVPNNSRSLAILNGKLFIGTTDSKIVQYTKPVNLITTIHKEISPEKLTLKFYPNPTVKEFYIHNTLELPAYLELYDIKGTKVLSENITALNQKIYVGKLVKGLYLIKLVTADHKQGNGIILVE